MKKLIALVLALAMVATLGLAFASEAGEFAGGTFGTAETTITANNLDSGDTVYYIQLVEWNGTNSGAVDPTSADAWKLTTAGESCGVSLAELLNGITAAEAATIATSLKNTAGTAMNTSGTTATADVDLGLYYLRAVATSTDTIYNAAFVAADYYAGNNAVSFSGNIGSSAVVKKSKVTFDKAVADANEYAFNDVKPGDNIPYVIDTTIPAYGAAYNSAKFEISDTFSDGLVLTDNTLVVMIDDQLNQQTYTDISLDDILTITINNDKSGFTVKFDEDYLLDSDRGVTTVQITYNGTVTTAAPLNVNPLDNKADLVYSNKPGETSEKHDITRHYTFSIDGKLLGDSQKITKELLKVGLDKNGNVIESMKQTVHEKEISPLGGASFTLSPVAGTGAGFGTNPATVATIDSTTDGTLTWNGLDAGIYKLVENSAPDGYVKDSRDHYIGIKPYYDKDVLQKYEIYFGFEADFTKMTKITTFNMNNPGPLEVITTSTQDDNHGLVANPQGTELPSTGGIGTTIFYIVGGLLVIGAAVILVARRKASN